MTSAAEWAWAAGLFEGEGCIHRQKGQGSVILIITSTDKDVLEQFAEIVRVGSVRATNRKGDWWKDHWKDQYVWRVQKWPEVKRILEAMLPWFGERRGAKATAVLASPPRTLGDFRHTHCKNGHPLSGPGSDVHIPPKRPHQRICRQCRRDRADTRRAATTHCPNGHEFTPVNEFYYGPEGKWRGCRECRRNSGRKRHARFNAEGLD